MIHRCIYQVAVGSQSRLYDHCISSVEDYCLRMGFAHVLQKDPVLKIRPDSDKSGRSSEAVSRLGYLPIFEKENAFDQMQSTKIDEMAIIDADVYIRKSTKENIFDQLSGHAFSAMIEDSGPITKEYVDKLIGYSRMQYKPLEREIKMSWLRGVAQFRNMGVMLFSRDIIPYLNKQDARGFLGRPEFQRFVNGEGAWKWSTDQTLLNYWLLKENIETSDLSWRWNTLYTAIEPEKLKEAYAVHFFLKDKLPNRGENVEELMKAIGE
mgnify:CR=1 FL=1